MQIFASQLNPITTQLEWDIQTEFDVFLHFCLNKTQILNDLTAVSQLSSSSLNHLININEGEFITAFVLNVFLRRLMPAPLLTTHNVQNTDHALMKRVCSFVQ